MTKDIIISEGIRQFNLKGLKFKMDDISESLHISKKTIYVSFASKEELLMAMLDTGFAEIHKTKQNILESDLPLVDKLRKVMIAMPDQYLVIDFRSLAGLRQQYPEVEKHLRTHLENDWEPVIALMEEGIKQGILKPFSIPVHRTMFTASLESFLSSSVLKDNEISYSTALDLMMDIIMEGVTCNEKEN